MEISPIICSSIEDNSMSSSATETTSQQLIRRFREVVGEESLLYRPEELIVYECDGYVVEKNVPDVVVFPENREQIVELVHICNELDVPFVPRGAGTSLAGGTLPVGGGVMITLTRMREIVEINYRDRYAVVQPGLVNVHLTQELKGSGYHYAPDPSSQGACTLGGNVATNSGGPHTLKYGVTVNHVLGVEYISPEGEVIQIGGPEEETPGYDLTGLFVGSEGTFGICTKIWVRLTRDPKAHRTLLGVFETVKDATETISAIIGAGIIPAALEMMDQGIIAALEEAFHFGFPLDAGAVLLIETDGLEVSVENEAQKIEQLCSENSAREVRRAETEQERQLLWKCRKQAFGAIGRLSPSYCTQDGVVPRTKLPEILEFITEASERHCIRVVNVFHAGDGNIHPILLFDERDPDQIKQVMKASDEILNRCIDLGGSVTGEHGIGVEKISFMKRLFTEEDLEVMGRIRISMNPKGNCSPSKMLPTAGACGMEHIERNHPGKQAHA